MDPFTIVQTAGAALEAAAICMKACGKIYEFTHDVKTIDKTLSRVEDEVRDLDRVLKSVSAGLADHSVQRTGRTTNGQQILKAVNGSVERSRYVLNKLEGILKVIIGDATGQSTLVSLRQAVRSKRKSKELIECVTLVDKSKQSLNVCLTMLGVFMTANSQSFRRTGTEVEIEPLTKQLESALKLAKPSREDAILRRTATTVLERARSPHPESGLSRSSTLLPSVGDEQENDDEDIDKQEPVAKWMDLVHSARDTRRQSLAGHLREVESEESLNALHSDPTALTEPPNEKFQIRSVRNFMKRGNDNYARGNKEQALAQLEQAMQDARGLSQAGRIFIERDLISVRLNIADLQTGATEPRLDVAEEYLLQATLAIDADKRNSDADMQQTLFRAYFLLAKVYSYEKAYEEAEAYCLDALNVCIDMGDETSEKYWESHALLIQIYHGNGNAVKVTPLLDEMPEDWREKTSNLLFGSAQRIPNPPRPTERTTRGGRRVSSAQTHVLPASEPMVAEQSQQSHSSGGQHNLPTSPLSDQGAFEEKLEPIGRKQSLVSPPVRDAQDNVSILADAGFKGDFDPQEALAWAIVKDKRRIIHSLLQGEGIQVVKERRLRASISVRKTADLRGNKKTIAPLFTAIATPGRVMIAKMLLDHNAPIDSRDEHGRSLLEVAAMHGNPETISVLLDAGLTVHSLEGTHAFHLAAQHGHVEILRLFIGQGMKPDERDPQRYGRTALNWAAWRGHSHCVEFLINNGADPNGSDNGGSTPLMAAVRERHEATVTKLLHYFADANMVNDRGQSALIIACEIGQVPIARMILESDGAKVDIRDNSGWTALIWACNKKHIEMVELLLEFKANVNAQCSRGSRALDHVRQRTELYDLLRRYNAQPGTGVSRRGTVDDTYRGYVLI